VAFRSQPNGFAWTVKRVENEAEGGELDKGVVSFSCGHDVKLRIPLVVSSRER